jgi:ATP-dependent Clp protease ATP-binding subunit ClpC
MFSRFTDRATKVMALANQEAQRFKHTCIGTEHILLGLVEEGSGVGANVLKNLGVDLRGVVLAVEKLTRSGPDNALDTKGRLSQTVDAKKVIEFAIGESGRLGHNYVGTEHLLLGLLGVEDSTASRVLVNLGIVLGDAREELLMLLGAAGDSCEFTQSGDRIHETTCFAFAGDSTLPSMISAILEHLHGKPATPGRLLLALLEANPELKKRLTPVMDEIRKACAEP